MSTPRAVIVSAEASTIAAVARMLIEHDIKMVAGATTAAGGIAVTFAMKPNIVVIDLELPGSGALEVGDAIKAESESQVIFFDGIAAVEQVACELAIMTKAIADRK